MKNIRKALAALLSALLTLTLASGALAAGGEETKDAILAVWADSGDERNQEKAMAALEKALEKAFPDALISGALMDPEAVTEALTELAAIRDGAEVVIMEPSEA